MAQLWTQPGAKFSFTGSAIITSDPPSGSPVSWAFPDTRSTYAFGDNTDFPSVIDANAFPVSAALGVKLGRITFDAYLKNDRNLDTFLNTFFGPRQTSGPPLMPASVTIRDAVGSTPVILGGVFITDISVIGAFGIQGSAGIIGLRITAFVIDPSNVIGYTAAAVPGVEGTEGTDFSTFAKCSFSNGAASTPTIYDLIKMFRLDISNGAGDNNIIPSVMSDGTRRAQGYVPSQLSGRIGLTQLLAAANPLPQAAGINPFNFIIPDTTGSEVLTIATSMFWTSSTKANAPADFAQYGIVYNLFGTSSTNATGTATPPWPMVASRA